jgi:hypothetical protein
MTGKYWETRWKATIAYLDGPFLSARLGTHIKSIVPHKLRQDISLELSLGSRPDGADDPAYADNTDQRHALRALLLCQRVYYSALWAREGPNTIPANALKADWKAKSLRYWANRSEAEIQDGIKMFAPVPGAKRSDLHLAAFAAAPNGKNLDGNLKVSRRDNVTLGFGATCYVGVQGWLVRSGLVSLRWFMMNRNPSNQAACDLLFGPGREVWRGRFDPAQDQLAVRAVIANIQRGYIVHIWSPQNYNWNGHWVVTNGDGTICGVNNGVFLASKAEKGRDVRTDYTNHSTLYEQFTGYGGALDKDVWRTAVMAVIDPKALPNQL